MNSVGVVGVVVVVVVVAVIVLEEEVLLEKPSTEIPRNDSEKFGL